MLSKPFSLALVFAITACNLVFMLLPLLLVALPFVDIQGNYLVISQSLVQKAVFLFWLTMFVVVGLMSLYLFCDFLFGFSFRASLLDCIRFEKSKDYDFLAEIYKQLKEKFDYPSVKLYIKNSDEINAYAVGSLGRGAIVLTRGLIEHYLAASASPKVFLYSLRSVLGHEMSHLINKDFLPAYLIITNQKITNLFSNLLNRVFGFFIKILRIVPFCGGFISSIFRGIYIALNRFIFFFNKYVVYGIHEFLRRFASRGIEYRCDKQSGQAFGGKYMAYALSMLGKSGYFTIFSTHPSTKSRVSRVESIEVREGLILPSFVDALVNGFAFLLIFLLLCYSGQKAHFFTILRELLQENQSIYQKLSGLWHLLKALY
jgi:Zn-dependent protease with chaperone function